MIVSPLPDSSPHYLAGSQLCLQLATGIISVTVVNAYTPFAISQLLLILLNDLPIIAKVHDTRFLSHRSGTKNMPPHPWSYEFEVEAIRQTNPNPNLEFAPHPASRVGEVSSSANGTRFRNEVESCQRLRCLEGQGLPLFLGSGSFLLEGRSFSPHVVLLEYIQDAVTLKDIAVRPKPSIISSLAKTVSAFGVLGVTHNDLTLDNIEGEL
jgi:hypothetical protein